MAKATDISISYTSLTFIPVELRVPLKFGAESCTRVTCARACVRVKNAKGKTAEGWGETPISVTWVWPSKLSYEARYKALISFCERLCRAWRENCATGHPMEIGHAFTASLRSLLNAFNRERDGEPMPWLAGLVCSSAFDIALHDAYGILNEVPIYETYNTKYMNRDLAHYLTPASGANVSFEGLYPESFFHLPRSNSMPAWHLVGGMDPVDRADLTGKEPADGYPVLLTDWIRTDGLTCLKVKLRGNDAAWDYDRLVKVGKIGMAENVDWLTTDFNCMVTDPSYVNGILDKLVGEHPRIYRMILYVEQPFPYDLEQHPIDVHSVAARKPLFMDESAHDWELIKRGRELGWTGVALKTCKTQTGALLSLCWAKAHGMTLMVQDLTNPMLAQIPHVLLAAHAGTIMGVETNAMQFYPSVSAPEAAVHPGIYRRRNGCVDLATIDGPGFGYKLDRIKRVLPKLSVECGA